MAKAANELGMPVDKVYVWVRACKNGRLDIGAGTYTPESAMTFSEKITFLCKRIKEQDKEIRKLKEENEFLEEASAFFAASRQKSAKFKG